MRPRSIIVAVAVIIIAAATLYYVLVDRNQAISADINAVMESTADAATTTAVKTALALNKQVSAFDIHVRQPTTLRQAITMSRSPAKCQPMMTSESRKKSHAALKAWPTL